MNLRGSFHKALPPASHFRETTGVRGHCASPLRAGRKHWRNPVRHRLCLPSGLARGFIYTRAGAVITNGRASFPGPCTYLHTLHALAPARAVNGTPSCVLPRRAWQFPSAASKCRALQRALVKPSCQYCGRLGTGTGSTSPG